MPNLTTEYMGLKLKNPIIASSSGLTSKLSDILELEKQGVGAVVLKSLFEEEIIMETKENMTKMHASGFVYPETVDYFEYDEMEDPIANYLKLIADAKKETKIPIIASVNCVSSDKWTDFAKRIQDAGADAIELNIFVLPTDFNRTAEENERIYFNIINKVTKLVSIPVAVKISHYNTALGNFIKRLSETPIKSIVLFNRSYSPDFDINTLDVTSSKVLSTSNDLTLPLRWIAIMAKRVNCDLAASTGVHTGQDAVKAILAGANAIQVASTLYKNGKEQVGVILKQIEEWMREQEFSSIEDFRGKLSQKETYNPAAFERVQFMKYFRNR